MIFVIFLLFFNVIVKLYHSGVIILCNNNDYDQKVNKSNNHVLTYDNVIYDFHVIVLLNNNDYDQKVYKSNNHVLIYE